MISTWLIWNMNAEWVHLDDFLWFFHLQFAESRRQSSFACCRIFSQEKEKLNFQWWHLQNESTQPMWLARVTMVHLEMAYHLSEVLQNLPTPNHLPHQKMLSTNCLQNECLNDASIQYKIYAQAHREPSKWFVVAQVSLTPFDLIDHFKWMTILLAAINLR